MKLVPVFSLLAVMVGSFAYGQPIDVEINPGTGYQSIEGFGASDAWQCQFVGANWPLEKRTAMADLLFSGEDDAEGNPQGIGLSIWRFNIGAGSAEQGEGSGIKNPWRRAECFLNQDGTYNWDKQAGQQWFLKAARERGVETLLAFVNSPPVYFTASGKAFPASKGRTINLQPDRFNDYADFLAEVLEHFAREGLRFEFVSPVNEPQWDWASGSQEGSPATNDEIYRIANVLGEKLTKRKLDTKIVLSEAGSLEHLVGGDRDTRDQIDAFWNLSSPTFVGNNDHVAPVMAGHGYYTTWPMDKLTSTRLQVSEKLDELTSAPAFWQSEYCILREDISEYGIGRGRKRDLGINTALFFARVIHHDLVLANAASWQFWTAITSSDYKDGLIYLDSGTDKRGKVTYDRESMQKDGNFHASKSLWALGNYSRFVRPGMRRIGVEYDAAGNDGLLISAYADEGTSQVVAVAVNYSEEDEELTIGGLDGSLETYTTSGEADLKKSEVAGKTVSVGRRSIVTVVGRLTGD